MQIIDPWPINPYEIKWLVFKTKVFVVKYHEILIVYTKTGDIEHYASKYERTHFTIFQEDP